MSDSIVFYNSWSKKKEVFIANTPGLVRIYNCGPTVYKRPHLGNLRRFLFADILRRTLEIYGFKVKEITNITDVGHLTQDELEAGEDKLEKEARTQKVTVKVIADRETKNFMDDLKALNIQEADNYPRASEHIKEMIDLIKILLDRGFAYETKVGVFFAVDKFKSYGKLSGNTVDKLAAGARLAVRKEKRQAADFALWLTDDPNHLQQWDAPWGRGYPGWHIECSAMSLKYLDSKIDIHTGGEDNKFPHHENEIAQSEAATGKRFVNYWMHNAHLQIGRRKLAKSSGQQITLDTVRDKGFSPLVFRWLVLSSHYRSKIDFSWERMNEMQVNLDKIKTLLRRLIENGALDNNAQQIDTAVFENFTQALGDDLNTPGCLAVLNEYMAQTNRHLTEKAAQNGEIDLVYATLMEMDRVLGVLTGLMKEIVNEVIPAAITKLGEAREQARQQKDWTEADRLKEEIIAAGFSIEDTKDGYRLLK